MTRREEINQQAEEYRKPYRDGGYRLSSKDVRDAFEEGAEWADKTMIEKVEQWLTKSGRRQKIGSFHRFLEEE